MVIIGYFTLKRVSPSRAREDDLVRAHILGLRLGLRGIALARVEMPKNSVRAFYRPHLPKKTKATFFWAIHKWCVAVMWPRRPLRPRQGPTNRNETEKHALRGAVLAAECDVGVLAGRDS